MIIDAEGIVRKVHIGAGDMSEVEAWIAELLGLSPDDGIE